MKLKENDVTMARIQEQPDNDRSAIEDYCDRVVDTLDVLENPSSRLRRLSAQMPPGIDPDVELRALYGLYQGHLGVDDRHANALPARVQQFQSKVSSQGRLAPPVFEEFLGFLSQRITSLVRNGATLENDLLISTDLWPTGAIQYLMPKGGLVVSPHEVLATVPTMLADPRYLPADHPLRQALRPEEYFFFQDRSWIVCGAADMAGPNPIRKPFFSMNAAIEATRNMTIAARYQRDTEINKRDEENRRIEETARREEQRRNPRVEIDAANRRIAALESRIGELTKPKEGN